MTALSHHRVYTAIGAAVAMTTLAALFYLIAWGMILFPEGSFSAKVVRTLTCGLTMGAAIGALTLVWVKGRLEGTLAIRRAAVVVAGVGSYRAWLCGRIDASFGYFGGTEYATLSSLLEFSPPLSAACSTAGCCMAERGQNRLGPRPSKRRIGFAGHKERKAI